MKKILPAIILLGAALAFWWSCGNSTDVLATKTPGVVFPNTEYSKAVAYHYLGEKGEHIIQNGKLVGTVLSEKVLDKEKVDRFLQVVNDSNSYGNDHTRCFRPHLGVVFYDKNDKPKAHVSICFECNVLYASPEILACTQKELRGFSHDGLRQLVAFCKELAFGHCDPNSTRTPKVLDEEEED
jgi:hypothetical protein